MINKPLPLVIVQRQTIEWASLSDAAFHLQSIDFCKLWGKPQGYIWELFKLWNRTFSADYRSIRQQLKEISLNCFQQVKGAELVLYDQYKNIPEIDGYYIFLDDDDWVSPDIALQLQEQLKETGTVPPLLLWRSANIGSPNQAHSVFVWGMNSRCMTNNYAVHGAWLKPFSKIGQVIQHKNAAKIFEGDRKIPHFDCALSVSNKSPISSVSLDRGLDGDLSIDRLKHLVETYVQRMEAVTERDLVYIPWAKKYLQLTTDVFKGLL